MTALLSRRPHRRVTPLAMLRVTLPAVALAGLVVAVVAALSADPGTGAGVLAGAALVAGAYAVGTAVLALADRTQPGLVLPVGLAVYAGTVLVLGGLLAVLVDEPRTGPVAGLPWGVVTGVLAWAGAHAWWWWTAPVPYVEIHPGP